MHAYNWQWHAILIEKDEYLVLSSSRQGLVEPDMVHPVDDHEDPPHRVQQRHHRPHRRGKQRQPTHQVLRQDLARQQEEVRRRRPHGALVPPREPAQHVGQGEEEPDDGAHDDVETEEAARVEDLARTGGGGGEAGGEGEAGEGEEVGRGEDGEGEVEGWDEAAGGEDHDEGDELELDHPEGAHDAAHHWLLRRWFGGRRRALGARADGE